MSVSMRRLSLSSVFRRQGPYPRHFSSSSSSSSSTNYSKRIPEDGYEARVRTSFAKQTFMSHLGAHLRDIQPGFVEIELDRAPHLCQQNGFL